MIDSIKIIQPDDWHVHFREGEMLSVVTKYSSRVNKRCIAMPNTSTPITTSIEAINYKKLIEDNSDNDNFEALIPCYLTDSLNIDDFEYIYKIIFSLVVNYILTMQPLTHSLALMI